MNLAEVEEKIYDALDYGAEARRQNVLEILSAKNGVVKVKPALLTKDEMLGFTRRCLEAGARPGPPISYNDALRRPQYWIFSIDE